MKNWSNEPNASCPMMSAQRLGKKWTDVDGRTMDGRTMDNHEWTSNGQTWLDEHWMDERRLTNQTAYSHASTSSAVIAGEAAGFCSTGTK